LFTNCDLKKAVTNNCLREDYICNADKCKIYKICKLVMSDVYKSKLKELISNELKELLEQENLVIEKYNSKSGKNSVLFQDNYILVTK